MSEQRRIYKILYLSGPSNVSTWSERRFLNLVTQVGCDEFVIRVAHPPGGPLDEIFEGMSIPHYRLTFSLKSPFRSVRNIQDAANDFLPDLIHVQNYRAALFLRCALRGSCTPIVYTVDSNDYTVGIFKGLKVFIERFQSKATSAYIVSSEATLLKFQVLGLARDNFVHLIPSGVNSQKGENQDGSCIEPFATAIRKVCKADSPNCVLLSYIHRHLNPEETFKLIDAIQSIRQSAADARFAIMADRSKELIQARIDACALNDLVTILQVRKDMQAFHKATDVYINLVESDDALYDLLQAADSANIIVSNDLDELENFFPSKDEIIKVSNDLSNALTAIVQSSYQEREKLRQAAHVRVRSSLQNMISAHHTLYEQLIEASRI